VAHQIAAKLPSSVRCVESNVGPAQRASFAYFGNIPFAQFGGNHCDFLLLQDNSRSKDNVQFIRRSDHQWQLLWEGHRPADRDERYRLYRRVN
jgi:hypothetical protein